MKRIFLSCLILAANMAAFAQNPIDNSSQQFHTNLEGLNYDAGVWTVDERGLVSSNLSGDGFVVSNTTAGANFVYEADVQFLNANESAASLVFGSTNNLVGKNMYVANIQVNNGLVRLFKFQITGLQGLPDQEALDLVAQHNVNRSADNKYRLSVTVIGKHIVYSLNGEVVANTADYTMGGVGGQNDAFTGHYLGLLSWKANCAYQNVYVTEITPATDPQLSGLSIEAVGGTVEHNVMFDSTQYVSITSVTNETQKVAFNFTKKSPSTNVVVKMGNTVYPDGIVPLQAGNNTVTLECTNGNAKVLYRVTVIRRMAADLYYNEFDRPQYHWSVKQGWSNDPNGLVYYNGEWHFFHQYYPGIDWGPMHWGHSVSKDLIHWTELPVALYPDEYGTMYSGSAVVDENNTSGLFKNADGTPSATGGMVLITTADGNGERVIISYSKDGRRFTKHEGVAIDWTEDKMKDRAFRDPKVFRYQNKWFMVIAGGPLRIYSSDNLLDWQIESTYANINTECPDLFPLAVTNGEPGERKWVLSRAGVGYKVGDFKQVYAWDGIQFSGKWTFVPDSRYSNIDGIMNYGNDAYATQTYSVGNFDVPQRVIGISWQNFHAPNIGKDNGNQIFNGQMTLQNEYSLYKDTGGNYFLQQTPIREYETLRDSANVVTLTNQAVNGITKVDFTGESYEIVAEFDLTDNAIGSDVGFRVRSNDNYYTKVGSVRSSFYTDRTNTGTGGYRDKFSQSIPIPAVVDGKLKMRIFVDRNCVEVFGADNTIVGSTLIYPAAGCNGLEVFANIFSTGSVKVNAQIFPIRSIWNDTTGITSKTELNPKANSAAIVQSGNMRFTVLTPELIRMEWSAQNVFEDRASFVVVNRNLPVPAFTTKEENGYLYITTDKLVLRYKTGTHPVNGSDPCDPNLQITLQVNGENILWYPGKKNPYNLKGTTRTLDNAEGDVRSWLEDGLLSRIGWAVIDEKQPRKDGSLSLMFDGSEGVNWVAQRFDNQSLDWYFLGYGHNYKKALGDFTKIAGKIPMPPLWAFGYWYSRYQRYSEQDFKDIVNKVKANDVPLDVMVIDMDWHRNGLTGSTDNTEWTGWSWNHALFPDPAEFIAWLHGQHLKTTLNLHPADGIFPLEDNFSLLAADLGLPDNQTILWNIEKKPFYEAFFNRILRPHENIGVDFWWLDWQQWMIARNEANLGNTFWLNHVFYSDKKLQNKGRPLIFHRWGGLGNHRYPIGFSGDTYSTFSTLAFQPYFTATASNVGYGYWSHDIGGHQKIGDNNPELYLRWIQYGVFSPILRTHASNDPSVERRIWLYPNFPLMRQALELRYALVPYIYTCSRYAYDTGISLCRPMYYDYPEQEEAYRYEGEYMFGNDILAAPITQSDNGTGTVAKTIWLPAGKWYEAATGTLLDGNQVVTLNFTQEQIPYFYREGAIIPLYPKLNHLKERPDTLILQFAPGDSGEFSLYEDEEDNDNYETGAYTFTKITQSKEGAANVYTIYPRQGSFAGMPEQRAYRLELLNKLQPASVEFADGQQGTYSYDAISKKITVNLPLQACNTKITVKITD